MDSYSKDAASNSNSQQALPPQSPRECAHMSCGFFGTPENHGFCSQHYKEYLKEKMAQTPLATKATVPHAVNNVKNEEPKVSMETAVSDLLSSLNIKEEVEASPAPVVKKKSRCESCKKKTGLLGFMCRCGGNYCGMHRYPEKHCCSFDFKTVGKSKIEKENPLVQASKLSDRL